MSMPYYSPSYHSAFILGLHMPYYSQSMPYYSLSMPYYSLSMPYYSLSMPYYSLSMPYYSLSMPYHSLSYHRALILGVHMSNMSMPHGKSLLSYSSSLSPRTLSSRVQEKPRLRSIPL
ncbi:MAG: uncharacterized protein KVP18_002249 [Porospora cf. gigantea A]|uniref:uncharacterized protein n=1 Tax=Porospora cf. gigantea A TaxID=2853593 RepID=UPI00355A40C7|nr:MAG: hypothetical protein KVP18_002249 [Porospora cf. gigantea A]